MSASEIKGAPETASANIFTAKVYDEEYWNNYLAARPKYSQDFYDLIYAYHDSHNDAAASSYSLAHDVGTGPGQVAAALAKRVSHVIGSDANPSHLEVAQHRLADLHAAGKVEFVHSLGEDLAAKCADKAHSADFIIGGESFALMDPKRATACFAELLKPGGTLAIWYYGRPIFVGEAECQAIYNKIVNKLFGEVIASKGNAAKTAKWKVTTEIMATWLDNVSFPEEQWIDVQRHKWNTHGPMTFYDDSACDFEVERVSSVTSAEKTVEKQDPDFWAESWNVAEVKRFVDVNLPTFREFDEEDKEVLGWFEDLSAAMGGKSATKHIAWPVVLVLATRK